jgi:hypothetical protein
MLRYGLPILWPESHLPSTNNSIRFFWANCCLRTSPILKWAFIRPVTNSDCLWCCSGSYTLGIEPFFFSHANKENATQTYATVTKYFVIFGSFIMLAVIVFADLFKMFMIRDASYWVAMKVVPLIILANFFWAFTPTYLFGTNS